MGAMLIVGNWKSYVEKKEDAKELVASAKRIAGKSKHKLVVAPPAPYLALFAGARSKVAFAAQDVSDTMVGAATGEISAAAAKGAGASFAIVGHSERRARGETDAVVAEKAVRALSAGLVPILCVGEKTRDREAAYLAELRAQLDAVFGKLPPKDRAKVIVAYEPVWAIGKTAKDAMAPADLAEMALYIRKILAQHLPEKDAKRVKVLYGGSVEEGSVRGLAAEGGVDGFLVGHASAEPKAFAALVKAAG